jgi:hypothetical protein
MSVTSCALFSGPHIPVKPLLSLCYNCRYHPTENGHSHTHHHHYHLHSQLTTHNLPHHRNHFPCFHLCPAVRSHQNLQCFSTICRLLGCQKYSWDSATSYYLAPWLCTEILTRLHSRILWIPRRVCMYECMLAKGIMNRKSIHSYIDSKQCQKNCEMEAQISHCALAHTRAIEHYRYQKVKDKVLLVLH